MTVRLLLLALFASAPTVVAAQVPVRFDLHVTQDGAVVPDLTADEVQVIENDVAQSIEVLEHVQAPAADRARLYVVFLESHDAPTVPLARFLDRLLGSDDLVALVTPETSLSPLVLGAKQEVIAAIAAGAARPVDPKERLYRDCYPDARPAAGIAEELIDRRRETLTLDALESLVARLDGLRDERKAVITVSAGWRLYRENRQLARALGGGTAPRPDPFGRRRSRSAAAPASGVSMTECETDRGVLARVDNSARLRAIAERANRGTISFYPVTPQALSGGPVAMQPAQQGSLRDLAADTDGQALLVDSDLEPGLSRITADMSSYYLLSYSSSNALIDGGFREVSIRVNRPGVRVRTRRGYRAPTAWELTEADTAVSRAFSDVASVSDRSRFRLRSAVWSRPTADGVRGRLWAVGELDLRTRREIGWTAGATGEVLLVNAAGEQMATSPVSLDDDTGTFTALFASTELVPGEYALRANVQPLQDGVVPVTDVARVIVSDVPAALSEPILWHRGPATGPRFAVTADPRFRRNESVRIEMATAAEEAPAARLLDRQGHPLPVPVTVSSRGDESGAFRWIAAEVRLAPLAVGSYAIEVTLGDAARVTAFSVIP